MFELGRELKRLFKGDVAFSMPRDGVAAHDEAASELLDLAMLRADAKAADIAAGRVSAKDRPVLQLRQAGAWREVARRSGDQDALRKAAAAAEIALKGVEARVRPEVFARIRSEQAICALLGVELGGDPGLSAAAGRALDDACEASPRSAAGAVAEILRVQIGGAEALLRGDPPSAIAGAAQVSSALAILDRETKDRTARRTAAIARLTRAELVCACGIAQRDTLVLEAALADTVRAALGLDPAYEPVSWTRATVLRGEILTALGETTGEASSLDRAVQVLASVFEHLPRDHSPLDWATAQYRLGRALGALAEAADKPALMDQARSAFEHALVVLSRLPAHPLRAAAAQAKGVVMIRQAELTGDRIALDAAEAAFRCELAVADPCEDEVRWAVCQVNLAQVYLARSAMTGKDKGERAKAGVALDAALEVFSEKGLKSLSEMAAASLDRLRATA